MSDVQETLQELVDRRLRELGARRGRGAPLSLREVHQTLPHNRDGKAVVSYETARQVQKGQHTNINDQTARALARMLDVSVSDVLVAAGRRPSLGRFALPDRADGLDDRERKVVISVVDAILNARETEGPRATSARESLGARTRAVAEREQARYDDERTEQEKQRRDATGA